MSFDADLFLKQTDVPFVPTLGAVHPRALAASVSGLISFAHDGTFLPYDKEKRWGGVKRERVLKDHIFQDESQTVIPTYQDGTVPLVRLYCYGVPALLESVHKKFRKLYPQTRIQAVSFGADQDFKPDSIVFLCGMGLSILSVETQTSSLSVLSPDIAKTIGLLAENDPDNGGFAFLKERLEQNNDDGEIFVTVENGTITGAVGPLKTMTDAAGKLTCYPVYYGVSKEYRRKGLGRALWSTAINWAQKNYVQYVVLQAQAGSPAEYFYHGLGLVSLGGVSRKNIS